jgi:hypothetical protein
MTADRRPLSNRQRAVRILVSLAVPPAAALAAIHAQPLSIYAARRPGLLALGMFAIAGAMLVPRLRRWLLVTLAYGAALLAFEGAWLRPSGRQLILPEHGPLAFLGTIYPWAWVLLFILAAFAGTLEAVRPGTSLAKRCLFSAAGVYLCGHGLAGMLARPNAISIVALLFGTGSFLGAAFLHRFGVLPPEVPETDIPTAEGLATERARRLARLEWRDPGTAR